MANRRKFLAGLGALASGSAAAVGTGAFTSATAQREIQLAIQADGNGAYLDFNPVSSYADTGGESGTLRLTFDENGGGSSATGLTSKANTMFDTVFQIFNNGTNDIEVGLPVDGDPRYVPGQASTQFLIAEADANVDPDGHEYNEAGNAVSFDSDYVDISWPNDVPAYNKPSNPVPEIGSSNSRDDRVLTAYKGKRYPGGKAVIESGTSVDVHVRFTISNARSSEDVRPGEGETAPLVFEAEEQTE
ncbi:hypothetical protein [Halorubrum sp. FL23]|uniref:hypothetical protein n=1 Tax=Halorubrum sp. FL23 TaxID=3458704 RepID=UPI004033AB54